MSCKLRPNYFALKLSDVGSQDGGAAEVGKLLRLRFVEDRNHGDRAVHHHHQHHNNIVIYIINNIIAQI